MENTRLQNILQEEFFSWPEYQQHGFVRAFRALKQLVKITESGETFGFLEDKLDDFLPAYGDSRIKDDKGYINDTYFDLEHLALDPIDDKEYFDRMTR